jgi:soluble lytic murein transglycosylase-like protein
MKTKKLIAAALAAGMTAFASTALANVENDAENQRPKTLVELFKSANAQAASEVDETVTGSISRQETAPVAAQRSPYDAIINKYASEHGVSPALAHAVIQVESNYRANARGRAGEIGLMQIKPATARMMGFRGSNSDLYSPEVNIRYGMKYLGKAQQLGGGDTCGTILRYNAGHGATRMNRISANYCSKVKRQLGML